MAVDKLVDSTQLNAALTATANAIRAKTGSSVSIPWNLSTGFQTAVDEIPTGGDENALINGTLSTYVNETATSIRPFGFCSFSQLTSVSFSTLHLK